MNRAQALKYARFKNGNRRQAIIEVLHDIELEFPANSQTASERSFASRVDAARKDYVAGFAAS